VSHLLKYNKGSRGDGAALATLSWTALSLKASLVAKSAVARQEITAR